MRMLVRLLVCGSVVVLGGCATTPSSGAMQHARTTAPASGPPASAPAPRAPNFAVMFHVRTCGPTDLHILDTASGTLVHTPLGETTALTVPLQLTDTELDAIYQHARAIDFFRYPADLRIPEDQVRGMQTPAAHYQLRMTNGTMTNTVAWTDAVTVPKRTDIEHFRTLVQLIEHTMQAHPEMHHLPEPKAGCA